MATNTFRSTKGASKHRRDLINSEIGTLRDMLPLPESARQRLSQLQIMSLACCYIRKCNYFTRLFGNPATFGADTPFEFAQAMTGFLLITTREGKLLYISDNVTEYLGHSMVDMMTQGDSLYDIIDKRDHSNVQSQLLQPDYTPSAGERRTFFCRMNVSRSFRRQAGFGEHKVMHVRGHFIQPLIRDHYGSQPVFMAICSPLVTPDVRESAPHYNTLMFQSVHGLDMSYIELAPNGEFHLGYNDSDIRGRSWYELLHPEDIHEAKEKHIQLVKSSHEMGCMLTVRLQASAGHWVWLNMVMHIRQPFVCDNGDPAIVCINHVISEAEAPHFKLQSQLYSSHIARSPEFLGPAQGGSPSHTITHVPADRDIMVQIGGQEQGTYRVDFTTSSITEPLNGCGATSVSGVSVQQGGYRSSVGSDSSSDACDSPTRQLQPLDKKQLLRQDIINRLKRKVQMPEEQCKPAKIPRANHQEGHDASDGLGGISIQGSAFITGPIYDQDLPPGPGPFGSLGVLGPVGIHSGPIYSNLIIKKDVEMVVPESPKINPKVDSSMVDIHQPLTPPTPESVTSEYQDNHNTTTQLMVDVSESAVVPASLLTPEASPLACEWEDMSFYPEGDITAQTQVGVKQEKLDSSKQKSQSTLPELDLMIVENFMEELEGQSKLAGLIRPNKPHATEQSRIAEIKDALKEAERQLARTRSPPVQNVVCPRSAFSPSTTSSTVCSRYSGVVGTSAPTTSIHNSLNAGSTMTSSCNTSVTYSTDNVIPIPVAAMETTSPSDVNSMEGPSIATLAASVTEALLDMVRGNGESDIQAADITGNFMLVRDCATTQQLTSDERLLLDMDDLTNSEDLFTQLHFTSASPSNGDVDRLAEAVFDTTL